MPQSKLQNPSDPTLLYWGYIWDNLGYTGVILGLYWGYTGVILGYIGVILGLYGGYIGVILGIVDQFFGHGAEPPPLKKESLLSAHRTQKPISISNAEAWIDHLKQFEKNIFTKASYKTRYKLCSTQYSAFTTSYTVLP